MTGTIDEGVRPHDGEDPFGRVPHSTAMPFSAMPFPAALIEQAKGVLIFRYGVDAPTALSVLEWWSDEVEAPLETLAHCLVHHICQGDDGWPSDPSLVRWLEERLRHELPGSPRR